ncbi:hypothetical protein LCGC14_2607590, partial [marine sediment metagenome]
MLVEGGDDAQKKKENDWCWLSGFG